MWSAAGCVLSVVTVAPVGEDGHRAPERQPRAMAQPQRPGRRGPRREGGLESAFDTRLSARSGWVPRPAQAGRSTLSDGSEESWWEVPPSSRSTSVDGVD